jgi:hypothetical protein
MPKRVMVKQMTRNIVFFLFHVQGPGVLMTRTGVVFFRLQLQPLACERGLSNEGTLAQKK